MTDPEQTQPGPNTPRNLLAKLAALAKAHPEASFILLAFVAGWLMGKLL